MDPQSRLERVEGQLVAHGDRLAAIERDLAVVKAHLSHLPTTWNVVSLILPIYGLLIFGFAGLFYFLAGRP
ncbi:MAG TPA: hypothetical protein VKD28_01980 [Gemmatimonadales bacterium]|nr:hypothetical protein [Gemmatimonadales bacterium]